MEYVFDPRETGYVIASGDFMNGALHIEKFDESDRFATDEEAARQAERDGIPLVYGLPVEVMDGRDVAAYIATPENRTVLAEAMQERYGDDIRVGNLDEIKNTGAALATLMNKVASLQNLLAAYQAEMLDVAFSLGKTEEELGEIFQTDGKPDVGRLYDPDRFDDMSGYEFVEACSDFREENKLGIRELEALSGMVKDDISATQKDMEEMAGSLRELYAKKGELDAASGKGVVLATFDKGEGQGLPAALIYDHTVEESGFRKPYVAVESYNMETGERQGERYFANVSDAYDAANPEVIEGATVRWQLEDIRVYLRDAGVDVTDKNIQEVLGGDLYLTSLASNLRDAGCISGNEEIADRVEAGVSQGNFEKAADARSASRESERSVDPRDNSRAGKGFSLESQCETASKAKDGRMPLAERAEQARAAASGHEDI